MDQTVIESVTGVKAATLVFSFIGAAVSLSYTREMTRGQAITAVFAGASVAVSAAPLALHYLGLPDPFEGYLAFFAGLVAMRAVPVLFAVVDRFRNIRLPSVPESKE